MFVTSMVVGGEMDWAALTARDVTRFVVKECSDRGGPSARNMVAALRSLLRFAHVDGWTPSGLVKAVPSVAGWQARSLPRWVAADDVRRLLGSCDRRGERGRRDYAMLLMLVRLGLRAGEVAGMGLDDIDWRAGEVVVHGKGRSAERMPLPNDVGEALADYLREGRPVTVSRSVFLRLLAPRQGLTPTGVTSVVYDACDRAGLDRIGAHRQAADAAWPPASRAHGGEPESVSYTHLRAHETVLDLVCRLLLEKKKKTKYKRYRNNNTLTTTQTK